MILLQLVSVSESQPAEASLLLVAEDIRPGEGGDSPCEGDLIHWNAPGRADHFKVFITVWL